MGAGLAAAAAAAAAAALRASSAFAAFSAFMRANSSFVTTLPEGLTPLRKGTPGPTTVGRSSRRGPRPRGGRPLGLRGNGGRLPSGRRPSGLGPSGRGASVRAAAGSWPAGRRDLSLRGLGRRLPPGRRSRAGRVSGPAASGRACLRLGCFGLGCLRLGSGAASAARCLCGLCGGSAFGASLGLDGATVSPAGARPVSPQEPPWCEWPRSRGGRRQDWAQEPSWPPT